MPEFLKAIFMLLKILLKKNESNWTGGSGDICIVSFSRTDSYTVYSVGVHVDLRYE